MPFERCWGHVVTLNDDNDYDDGDDDDEDDDRNDDDDAVAMNQSNSL